MTLSLLPRMAAPLRLAARAAAPAAAPSAGILTRWAASAATPTPAPGALVTGSTTAGPSYATTATSSARNAPVANLQGAQPIGNSEYVVRLWVVGAGDGGALLVTSLVFWGDGLCSVRVLSCLGMRESACRCKRVRLSAAWRGEGRPHRS